MRQEEGRQTQIRTRDQEQARLTDGRDKEIKMKSDTRAEQNTLSFHFSCSGKTRGGEKMEAKAPFDEDAGIHEEKIMSKS